MAENPGHFLLHGSHYLYLNLVPGCNRSVGDGLLNRDKHGNPGIFYQYSYVKVNVYTATDKGVFFGGILGLAFILLLTHFNFYTVTFFLHYF